MNSTSIQLPEKAYFSITEIAERWGCAIDLVTHYLDEGRLREAIHVDVVPPFFTAFVDTRKAAKLLKVKGERWPGAENLSLEVLEACGLAGRPRWLYVNRKNVRLGCFDCVEDLDGNSYVLLATPSEGEREIRRINLGEVGQFVITREERDRFERLYAINGELREAEASYRRHTTPHLEILKGAIAEFFEPRRSRDAKKEEVVRWIIAEMEKKGGKPAKYVAESMFTIIKPVDHNPKRRKG
tara:strand:+ start:7110 stop:7832 length:723 start_codon:yes stop_codon:yes gene_type:complete